MQTRFGHVFSRQGSSALFFPLVSLFGDHHSLVNVQGTEFPLCMLELHICDLERLPHIKEVRHLKEQHLSSNEGTSNRFVRGDVFGRDGT